MIESILILLGFELVGEVLRGALHLPVPGPVLGMLLLAAVLVMRDRREQPSAQPSASPLDRTANMFLEQMGLLFVPAGVGLLTEAHLLRQDWLPILAGVIGSTLLSLAVTGLVMHHVIRSRSASAHSAPALRGLRPLPRRSPP